MYILFFIAYSPFIRGFISNSSKLSKRDFINLLSTVFVKNF
nr:MAG TPA: hypothetical protein [Bacteriophage sp.]